MSRAVIGTLARSAVHERDVVVDNAVVDCVLELRLLAVFKRVCFAHFEHHTAAFAGRAHGLFVLGASWYFDGGGATLHKC